MHGIPPFALARLPRILFGAGRIHDLPAELAPFGTKALLLTGARSFQATPHWPALLDGLHRRGVAWEVATVSGEPSPERVDELVARHREWEPDCVVGIGGGSVLDAAKAVAGLIRPGHSVMEHLEGVGPERPYLGPALPFVAVPTTAGTGSEATKNAVLSRHGRDGFKKSFRDDALVAQLAVIDPELLATCPPALLAADGMDAFTQLLESCVSTRANPLTEALAWSGMEAFRDGFFPVWEGAPEAAEGRARLAYASLLSGICLANTGLGSVHGLAAPLGAFFPIPHGVVCGTLLAEATAVNIDALKARLPGSAALDKYARAGELIAHRRFASRDEGLAALVETLRHWTGRLQLPRLAGFGVTVGDIERVVAHSRGSSMKTNPVVLEDGEIAEVVRRRL